MDEFLFVCLNGLKEFSVFGKRFPQRAAGVVFESGMRWMKPGLPAGGSELLVAVTGVGGAVWRWHSASAHRGAANRKN